MNQLPTLIEYLLLNHDFVVIPGWGTFIVQQMGARRNEEEEAFLPPYRSVRFNSDLSHDDTVLYESIQKIFNVGPEQANRMLYTWVSEYAQVLEEEEVLEFGSIGVFTRNADGSLSFSSHESGITSPDHYGLDAFHFSEVVPAREAKVVPLAATMESNDREITIRINRHLANVAVAACAAILLFIVFNSPLSQVAPLEQRSSLKELLVGTLKQDAPQPAAKEQTTIAAQPKATPRPAESEAEPEPEVQAEQPQETVEVATTPTAAAPQPRPTAAVPQPAAKPQAAAPAEPKPQAEAASEQPGTEPQYCIVMASAISRKNADNYVAELKRQGFNNPRVHTTDKMVRVVVGSYASESEAYSVAEAIRRSSAEHGSVWVLKI